MPVPYISNDDRGRSTSGSQADKENNNRQKNQFVLRQKNPLSDFSSYNYHISLYIVTPEFYNNYVTTGVFDLSIPEYFIVAQTAGVGNSERRAMTYDGKLNTSDKVNGDYGLDFYIDNVSSKMLAPSGITPIVQVSWNFNIIEPNGFTFLTKLSKTVEQINNISKMLQTRQKKPQLFQHSYIMAIRFYGYDENGRLLKNSDRNDSRISLASKTRDPYSFYERFFPITITKSTYRINGKMITYNMEASAAQYPSALGTIRGFVTKQSDIIAGTVKEALEGNNVAKSTSGQRSLLQILNENEDDLVNNGSKTKKNVYSIEWADANIKNSELVTDAEYNLAYAPMSSATRTSQSNIKISISAEKYNTQVKAIKIAPGTPIISIIDNIIAKSQYVTRTLLSVNSSELETTSKSNPGATKLLWYSVQVQAKRREYDEKTNDWAYDIKYIIQPYRIPYLRSLYKSKTSDYYGSQKKYDFFMTGQNTEVLSYEVNYDTQFYVIRTVTTNKNTDANENSISNNVPIHSSAASNISTDQGNPNRGSSTQENVKANINNKADQAIAKLRIIGDPDYLMQRISAPPPQSSSAFSSIYGGDGFSLNPYYGQIFFEIVFKMAEDYDVNGLLNVTGDIAFYERNDLARKANIEGIVYRLISVQSNFVNGQFTQDLEGVIVSEKELGFYNNESDAGRETSKTNSKSTNTAVTTQSNSISKTNIQNRK